MTILQFILIAIGSALFLEGICYAIFTKFIKRAMADLLELPEAKMQIVGLCIAICGFLILILILPSITSA